jgi:sec-independent protein translocase protein TatB
MEFIVIALVLLIVVGPRRMPEMLSKGARLMAQLRTASRDLRNQIDAELVDIRDVRSDIRKELVERADRLYAGVAEAEDDAKQAKVDIRRSVLELRDDLKKAGTPEAAEPEAPRQKEERP